MHVLRPWHIAVLVAVLILLFGAKRLPGAARSLGRSLRIIKAETRGLVDEPEPDDLEEKADAQAGRRPLSAQERARQERRDEAQVGEVLDASVERPRER